MSFIFSFNRPIWNQTFTSFYIICFSVVSVFERCLCVRDATTAGVRHAACLWVQTGSIQVKSFESFALKAVEGGVDDYNETYKNTRTTQMPVCYILSIELVVLWSFVLFFAPLQLSPVINAACHDCRKMIFCIVRCSQKSLMTLMKHVDISCIGCWQLGFLFCTFKSGLNVHWHSGAVFKMYCIFLYCSIYTVIFTAEQ